MIWTAKQTKLIPISAKVTHAIRPRKWLSFGRRSIAAAPVGPASDARPEWAHNVRRRAWYPTVDHRRNPGNLARLLASTWDRFGSRADGLRLLRGKKTETQQTLPVFTEPEKGTGKRDGARFAGIPFSTYALTSPQNSRFRQRAPRPREICDSLHNRFCHKKL